jgi:hypothetical protein
VEIAMMRTPDGHGRLELSRFLAPPAVADHRNAPGNALGYLRVMFAVDDIDQTLERLRKRGAQLVGEVVQYEHAYRLSYILGPEGLLIGLAQELSYAKNEDDDEEGPMPASTCHNGQFCKARELNETIGLDVADGSCKMMLMFNVGRTPQPIRRPGTETERNRKCPLQKDAINLPLLTGRQHWLADRLTGGKHPSSQADAFS